MKVKIDEVAFICIHMAQPTLSINQVSLKAGDEDIKRMGWRQFWRLISIALLLLAIIFPSVLADVVINEVGLDAQEDYVSQWIELYNTGDTDVDISSWSVVPLSDRTKVEFIDITNISAKGFHVLEVEDEFMDLSEDSLILRDESSNVVDRTPLIYNYPDSDCTWGRFPDGSNIWLRLESTKGEISLGELCGGEESATINFDMDQKVEGSGYANIFNVIHNRDQEYLSSRESGSGTYSSEEASKYKADLNRSAYAMELSKINLSARYSNSTFAITSKRSVNYGKKWMESVSVQGDQFSPSFFESHMFATRLDSDVIVHYKNYDLGAKLASEFNGVGRINSNLADFRALEEYAGSFKILNDYSENTSDEIRLSVEGEGFVSTEKEIGKEDADSRAYSYEKGTGRYKSEELIGVSDISALNISRLSISGKNKLYLAKDVSLHHAPINHSYVSNAPLPMSVAWKEGTGSESKNGALMSSDFSDISELEAETLLTSSEMRTSAQFVGRARLKTGYRDPLDPANGSVLKEDEYLGNFSINRSYKVYPTFKVPHMSLKIQGRIDPQDCSRLRYTITLVNDGNLTLSPVFVRTSFPSGTSYLDTSQRPHELTSRYANWSVSKLSIGESFNINLDLQIVTRKENYTSSSSAVTIYQQIRRNMIYDRKLRARGTSRLEADWSACIPGNLSAVYSATRNKVNPKIFSYRLTVKNLADENISAKITVTLPFNIVFINSSTRYKQLSEDTIVWTIDKLNAGKKKYIRYMAEAKEDGSYISNASVTSFSLDGRQIASIKVVAPVNVGKTVYEVTTRSLQDWCPCDENMLGKSSWNETSTVRGNDLGCAC